MSPAKSPANNQIIQVIKNLQARGMKYISSLRMKAIDRNCAYLGGLLPLQLMENAGAAVARSVKEKLGNGKVLFVAGRGGNNGGAMLLLLPGTLQASQDTL